MYFEKKYYNLKDTISYLSLVDQFVRQGGVLVPYLLPVCAMSEIWAWVSTNSACS